jgi:hypothetical protein
MIVPHRRIRIHHCEEIAFTSSATCVSHPVRSDVTHRSAWRPSVRRGPTQGLKNRTIRRIASR